MDGKLNEHEIALKDIVEKMIGQINGFDYEKQELPDMGALIEQQKRLDNLLRDFSESLSGTVILGAIEELELRGLNANQFVDYTARVVGNQLQKVLEDSKAIKGHDNPNRSPLDDRRWTGKVIARTLNLTDDGFAPSGSAQPLEPPCTPSRRR